MTDSLSVSVALCTRNGAKFVAEQVRSIAGQSYQPLEIVLSDDASTDGSVARARAALDEVGGRPIPLKVLGNREPLGVTANFEQAILACSGDLIALSDQDDVWHPDRLQVAVDRFEDSPQLQLLHSDARLVDVGGAPLSHSLFEAMEVSAKEFEAIRSGHGYEALLRRNLVTGATTVIRRSLIERAVPFPAPWVHDEWLAIIAAATGSMDVVAEELIDYRQHGQNQIGARKLGFRQKVARLVEPRGNRYRYLEDRAEALVRGLQRLGEQVPETRLLQAEDKLSHHRVRADLPAARVRRLIPVLRELAGGRYRRYSRGAADVLRDILQPA